MKTILLERLDISQQTFSKYTFYQYLSNFFTKYGLVDGFFLYRGHKIFISDIYAQLPIDLYAFWDIFDNPNIIILYCFTASEKSYLFQKQHQKYTENFDYTAPIFYLPFNFHDKMAVFSSSVNTSTMATNNTAYQVFSIAKKQLSLTYNKSNDIPYSSALYLNLKFADGTTGIANQPLTGTTPVQFSLPTSSKINFNHGEFLILYCDEVPTNITYGSYYGSIMQDPSQNSVPGVDNSFTIIALGQPYYSQVIGQPAMTYSMNFSVPSVTIRQAFIAKRPFVGNYPMFTSFQPGTCQYQDIICTLNNPNFFNNKAFNPSSQTLVNSTTLNAYRSRLSIFNRTTYEGRWSSISAIESDSIFYATTYPYATFTTSTANPKLLGVDNWYNILANRTFNFINVFPATQHIKIRASYGGLYGAPTSYYEGYESPEEAVYLQTWTIPSSSLDYSIVPIEQSHSSTHYLFNLANKGSNNILNYNYNSSTIFNNIPTRQPTGASITFKLSASTDTGFQCGMWSTYFNKPAFLDIKYFSLFSIYIDTTLSFVNGKASLELNTRQYSLSKFSEATLLCEFAPNQVVIMPSFVFNFYSYSNLYNIKTNNSNYEPWLIFDGTIMRPIWCKIDKKGIANITINFVSYFNFNNNIRLFLTLIFK